MGAAMIPAALTGLATLTSAGGVEAADRFKAQQSDARAKAGRTAAAQTDATLQGQLHDTLSNIVAIRASTGTDPFSPSGVAVQEKSIEESDRQRRIKVGSIMNQVGLDEQASGYYRSAAKNALFGGALAAGAKGFKVLAAG